MSEAGHIFIGGGEVDLRDFCNMDLRFVEVDTSSSALLGEGTWLHIL